MLIQQQQEEPLNPTFLARMQPTIALLIHQHQQQKKDDATVLQHQSKKETPLNQQQLQEYNLIMALINNSSRLLATSERSLQQQLILESEGIKQQLAMMNQQSTAAIRIQQWYRSVLCRRNDKRAMHRICNHIAHHLINALDKRDSPNLPSPAWSTTIIQSLVEWDMLLCSSRYHPAHLWSSTCDTVSQHLSNLGFIRANITIDSYEFHEDLSCVIHDLFSHAPAYTPPPLSTLHSTKHCIDAYDTHWRQQTKLQSA